MKDHILLKDSSHQGKEYGTLRSFEEAVIHETGAAVKEIPVNLLPGSYKKYFGQGMSRAKYRKFFSKRSFAVKADVAWYILMGPENYQLDLFSDWNVNCKVKILYLFDTLPSQYPLIKRLFSNNDWDVLITSFNDAADDLQALTGRKWYSLEQATDTSFFKPVALAERGIHFSAYGRREPFFHEAVKAFCAERGFHYDYTMAASWEKNIDGRDIYRQYAWQLNHSVFTFAWPVELTNPQRAGHLHPVTCRWFEAAAAGTVMIGKTPDNILFDTLLFEDAVQELELSKSKEMIFEQLQALWDKREIYHQYAAQMQAKHSYQFSWQERVRRILSWL